jgi:peptidoglycan/xylan/chitin deacetylase (PgdA/CDA1 family)
VADLDALYARRAAQRAGRRRRRRQLRVLALVVLVGSVGAILALVLAVGTARSPRPRTPRVVAAPLRPAAPVAAPRGDALGIGRIKRLAQLGLPVYCGAARGDAVAFTFDDGPGPYTYLAVRKLARAHQRATFFVVGRSMNFFPGRLARELSVAAIGDHTSSHPFLPSLSPAGISSELAQTKRKIERDSGQPVYLFRPPYGARNAIVDATARRLGLLEILWTVDSADSLGANWAGIIANVERGLRPGAIILMHENRGQTIRALTTLLPYLHRHHLRSVSLPELFASDSPSVTQLRRGPAGCGLARRVRTGA